MDRRRALWIVGAIVALIALAYGIPAFLYSGSHQGTDDAKIDADVVTVTNKISERIARILVDTNQPVSKGQLLIVLDDRDERTRYEQAQAAYRAQKAQADAATASVSLTRDEQEAQDAQHEGEILQARSNVIGASMQTESQQEQIEVAAAAVQAASAQLNAVQDGVPSARENLRKARADLERDTALVASGDIASSQLDVVRAAYQSARSAYEQSLANVSVARAEEVQARQKLDAQRAAAAGTATQIGVQRGELQTAKGKLKESSAPSRVQAQEAQADAATAQAKSTLAQVSTAADALSYTRIVSPIDGYVGEKNVAVGQTVSAGTPLLSLVPKKHVYVTARYKETQIGRMRVGQPVDIRIDAYPGVLFHGRVESLAPASENVFSLVPAQNATANFVKVTQRVPVRIAFDDSAFAYALRPGMSVEAYVDVR